MLNYIPIFNESVDENTIKKCFFIKHSSELYKRVPVYYYGSVPLVTLKMNISLEDKTFTYTVFDNNTGSIYAPYYNSEIGKNNIVVQEVEKNIEKEFGELRKVGVLQ